MIDDKIYPQKSGNPEHAFCVQDGFIRPNSIIKRSMRNINQYNKNIIKIRVAEKYIAIILCVLNN